MSITAHMDVPTCAACGSRACVPAASYPSRGVKLNRLSRDLLCVVCGWHQIGTEEQIAQAKEAERAWETRTDKTRGPWARVLRRRAREKTPQVPLFQTGGRTE